MGKVRVFLNSERPKGVLSWGHVHLHLVIGADISWKDSSDGIWKSGRVSQCRDQMCAADVGN
jgi:hypothetical protein